jgi:hypothetical protein
MILSVINPTPIPDAKVQGAIRAVNRRFVPVLDVDDPRAEPANDPRCVFLQDRCLVSECGAKEAGQH